MEKNLSEFWENFNLRGDFSNQKMDPEFERRLLKPTNGYKRTMSGTMSSPIMSPTSTPHKNQSHSSPATPLSSVRNAALLFHSYWLWKNVFLFQPSLRRKLFRTSPMSSPSKERYGDRFIPVRAGNSWETNFSTIPVSSNVIVIYECHRAVVVLLNRVLHY